MKTCCRSLLLLLIFTFAAPRAAEVTPFVTILVPGFSATELPSRLSNINNLRFRPDGKLTALGYDGRVHILSDSDGDGTEDTSTLFWDKSTLSAPVGMVWSLEGLYVSSHGKVSLLKDTDGDDRADVEEVITKDWPPTDVASGGVDASAITRDADGNLYFALLTANYANPYRVKDGISHYDLQGKRGTIQKWHHDTKKLETIATGVRVPYTLAFNQENDLFVTDQEGETWCPGGNPFDELNHIVLGKNYGFPPRHPEYLPNLISEPPVVSFGPQHQSSCGMVFNIAPTPRKTFGPTHWVGDALVAGQSRGKIWRATMVKTRDGYVGREMMLVRLQMLTTDVAISPRGELYISCHSGKPDWGTGPRGEGKLFKIAHTDPAAPQPIAAWPVGPMEVTVAFDKPLDPSAADPKGITIEFGQFVSAADRLENLKPPYEVVAQQSTAPRGKIRVISASLSPDRKSLYLKTDPHPQSVRYAVTLPNIKADGARESATVDLEYNLNGVEATWSATRSGQPQWTGWWPHLDPTVARKLVDGSPSHAELQPMLSRPGELTLRANLIAPAPGTRYHLASPHPFSAAFGEGAVQPASKGRGLFHATLSSTGVSAPLVITIPTKRRQELTLEVSYSSQEDPTLRPLPLASLLLPWAAHTPPTPPPARISTASKGDYENGRALFSSDRLKCSSCHHLRGIGKNIGPDLGNLAHRDPASVLQDITHPDAAINPDYVAYTVELRSGDQLQGFVRAQDENMLRLTGADGAERQIARADILEMEPSSVSLMPSGIVETLKPGELEHLLTFLTSEPPQRDGSELKTVLAAQRAATTDAAIKDVNIVLVGSKQDHGPGQHDYPKWQEVWSDWLSQVERTKVSQAWEWPSAAQWKEADVVALYYWNHRWDAAQLAELDAFQARGGGLVLLHSATISDKEPLKLVERIGLAAEPKIKYRHMPITLDFTKVPHPITAGFKSLNLLDEPYWPLLGDTNDVQVLANAIVDGSPRPLMWTFEKGDARVFGSIPGHYTWTLDDPVFRVLIARAIAWTARASSAPFERAIAARAKPDQSPQPVR